MAATILGEGVLKGLAMLFGCGDEREREMCQRF